MTNLVSILGAAKHHGGFVRIDMEGSALIDQTLDIFEGVWAAGHRNVGVVLQSYLYRTEADLQRALDLGARVRLVKGAYNEQHDIAYANKGDVDAAFVRLAYRMLAEGAAPAFATHDPRMIDAVCTFAKERGIGAMPLSFRCFTEYGGTYRPRCRPRAMVFVFMSRLVRNGSRTSCADWQSVLPMSGS